jgi:uncharacterized protein YjiS (DUF1127 family)
MLHQLPRGFVPSADRTLRADRRSGLFTTWWTALLATLCTWNARSRQRHALSRMVDEPHLLKDIGVSQQEALRETEKWFWKP